MEISETTNKLSERLDSIARIILFIVVFLLPLAVLPATWLPLPMVKMAILSFGVLSSLILWSIARLNEHKVEFPSTNVLWTALLLVVGYFLTSILSSNIIQSLVGFGFERDTVLSMFTFVGFLVVVALTTSKVAHVIRLQQAALAAFLILGIFQIARIILGADLVFPSLFSSDPTATLLGSWNDLAVFSGLALMMSLSGLALFSSRRLIRGGLYTILAVALFLLAVVNLTVVWAVLALITFILAIYIFSDASYDRDSGKFRPRVPFRRLLPSIFILIVSIVFLVAGTSIGQRISQTFDIAYIDVRPSWEGTVIVGTGVFQENALFGVGPNSFSRGWIAHKPLVVNETNFWNTDFNFGVGLIPTAFITGGLVLGVLWLLFLASFIQLGFRMFAKRIAQPAHMYIAVSSFVGAGYLLALSIVYVPQTVMLAYTFALIGIAIASAQIVGVIRTRSVQAQQSYSSGIVLTGVVLLIAVASFGALAINSERIVAGSLLSRAIVAANSNDLPRAEYIASRISLIGEDVRGLQLQTRIGLVRLSETLNEESKDIDIQRERFQQELSKTISAAQGTVAADNGNYQSWLTLADVYASLVPLGIEGAYESAVQAYGEAASRNEKNPAIPIRLARLALSQDDLEDAQVYAQSALGLKSNYTDAYYLLSQISIREGNVLKAIESTEAAVLLQPGNAGLLFQLGILHYSVGAYDKVVPVLERAIAINLQYSNALYFLGLAYDKVDNSQGALAAFERIAALNPENTEVQSIIAAITEGGSAFDALGDNAPVITGFGELPVSNEQ
ncbi:MAG: hypothetical protein JKX80_00085 [Candidatus Pacebacteria bacterium]|nr:hypothetical protein [Candidatus Paceibacterota bacterium]